MAKKRVVIEAKVPKLVVVDTPFLDIDEAAAFLKVKPKTIYSWAHQRKKKFPVRHHGRRLVFSKADLELWSKTQNDL